MFSLIYARINGGVNTGYAGDLRTNHAHYDVIVITHLEIGVLNLHSSASDHGEIENQATNDFLNIFLCVNNGAKHGVIPALALCSGGQNIEIAISKYHKLQKYPAFKR